MRIVAIDPGIKSGAWGLVNGATENAGVGDIPHTDDGINAPELFRLLRELEPDHVVVERASSRPGQSVSAMFKYGQAYGTILGVVGAAYLPYSLITPASWKGAMRLAGKDKKASLAAAVRLYPQVEGLTRVMDHNRAEALLLAHYFKHIVRGAKI